MTDGPAAGRVDLTTRAQVHDLVVDFYREVALDEVLEPMFGEVAEVDWADHIPRLIDYWSRILFGGTRYRGAVMGSHRRVHALRSIEPVHCDRWYSLWCSCVDRHAAGPNAERVKRHAVTIMGGMAKRIFGFAWHPSPAG